MKVEKSNFRWVTPKRKYRYKSCFIKFDSTIFSNDCKIEMYGTEMDIELGITGILISYLNRGYTIEDIKEIVNRLEENGKECF